MAERCAVVLFNLGGPDRPESVEPFLFNLFNDPAIIGLPTPFRWFLAKIISRRRAPVAREIYAHLGGKSPLLEQTIDQAKALETVLNVDAEQNFRVFVCMRYWHPMSEETAQAVKKYAPDQIVLLPLYPQFSTTTSGSSLTDWYRAASRAGLAAPVRAACCYPLAEGMIAAQARLVVAELDRLPPQNEMTGPLPRVLFSAHGLPKKVIDGGDPYQWQVEQTSAAVVDRMITNGCAGFEPVVCYQSKVGPLEWIGPSTEEELERAGRDGAAVVVVPIAFISEHSETLVELDIEYRELADAAGIPAYHRVPAMASAPEFIDALAEIVRRTEKAELVCAYPEGPRLCPAERWKCPVDIV